MVKISLTKGRYPQTFGGVGFHNNDATMYHVMQREHFNQYVCKCYRETSPGFMRTFAGFSDWTREAMDEFADYYEKMQKWTDTPMYLTPACAKKHVTEEEKYEYCENVAKNLEYLYYEKNVKHIRFYCFSNELSCVMWNALGHDLETFKHYHELLYDAFQRHRLPIGLLATDATEYKNWWTVDWAIDNMADISEDYCVHIYEREHSIYDTSFYNFFYNKCRAVTEKAIVNFGKRVILGEAGIQKNAGQLTFNGNVVIDTCRYFEDEFEEGYCALMLSEMAFAAINAGVFGMAYWSYIDHPDPYSCAYSTGDEYAQKWGEAEKFFSGTTDSKYNKWGFLKWNDEGDYTARKHYWCLGLLVKLFKGNSKVLSAALSDPLLRVCAIMNRDGSVSVGIVNRHKRNTKITLASDLFNKTVRVYEYDPKNVPTNKFADLQAPSAYLEAAETLEYELRGESVTFFTTDYKEKAKTVFAKNVKKNKDDTLSWAEADDPEHCYWRVFASAEADFECNEKTQIASTVACSLPIENSLLNYKVISVDKSGNV